MEWFEKFKVGQEVRVVKKVPCWVLPDDGGTNWNNEYMDKTIGSVYKIIRIDDFVGYLLFTQISVVSEGYTCLFDYWYPVESLESVNVKGQQLVFNFMKE
jgi:hypothetical protein